MHEYLYLDEFALEDTIASSDCLVLYQLYELLRVSEALTHLLAVLFRYGLLSFLLGSFFGGVEAIGLEKRLLLVVGSDEFL